MMYELFVKKCQMGAPCPPSAGDLWWLYQLGRCSQLQNIYFNRIGGQFSLGSVDVARTWKNRCIFRLGQTSFCQFLLFKLFFCEEDAGEHLTNIVVDKFSPAMAFKSGEGMQIVSEENVAGMVPWKATKPDLWKEVFPETRKNFILFASTR